MARISRRRMTPDETPADGVAGPPRRALTAAVRQITTDTGQRSSGASTGDAWQTQAWDFYDQVGELQFVCTWLGNALSRCQIIPSRVDDRGNPTGGLPVGDERAPDDELAAELAGDIAGGPAGQAELLERLATFFTIPGEGVVAIIHRADPNRPGSTIDGVGATLIEEWHVLSTDEVNRSAAGVELTLDDGTKYELQPELDSLVRLWRPHPRHAQQATSPVRSARSTLREIVRCGQVIEAVAKSRLAGAGLLLLPNELSIPGAGQAPTAQPDPDAPGLPLPMPDASLLPESATTRDVMQTLVTAMSTALENPDSAASTVPVVMQAPAASIASARLLTFATDLAESMLRMRESAVKRFAMTVDAPAEVLLGMGDANHWSAWQIEESAIKLHVEPMLTRIVQGLTEAVYRPMLGQLGVQDPEAYTLWYDTSELAARPNRAQDARDARAAGAISDHAYRQILGFTDADAPFPLLDANGDRLPNADLLELCTRMMLQAPASLLPLLGGLFGIELQPQNTEAPAPEAPDDGEPAPPADEQAPIPDTQDEAAQPDTTPAARLARAVELAARQPRG